MERESVEEVVLPGDSAADLNELCEFGLISEDEMDQVLDAHE